MRNTFINRLVEQARQDQRIFLLVGDLGFSVVELYANEFPDRFLNAGVAEQNMTGMAAGLAREGYKVFTYSIANFNTMRCLEQIRNDICYHDLDVTVVSVGGGLSYGNLGYSHFAVQDIAILGSMPHMTLLLPGDPLETRWCVDYAVSRDEPKYLRLGKTGEPILHNATDRFAPISRICSTENADIAIVGISNILFNAKEVFDRIIKHGIKADLYSIPVMMASDFSSAARDVFKDYRLVFTIEEHVVQMGMGVMLNDILRDHTRVVSFGIDKNFCKIVGSQLFLQEQAGLGPETLVQRIMERLSK